MLNFTRLLWLLGDPCKTLQNLAVSVWSPKSLAKDDTIIAGFM